MAGWLNLFGHDVEPTGVPKHRDAVADLIDTGNPTRQLKQPIAMRPLYEKLASGAPVALTDSERAQVERQGIALEDCTLEVHQREATAAYDAGISRDVVNARPGPAPHYRPVNPVRFVGSFIPSRAY